MVGVDKPMAGGLAAVEAICGRHPPNCAVTLFYPGYSTSVWHGGLHPSRDGGTLRTSLSYLVNSSKVAYLDDDNWWHPSHLRTLLAAIQGHQWAWSLRWYVHQETRQPLCVDEWESIGPDKGYFKPQGGWVDPNCLMIDKMACEPILRLWSLPPQGTREAVMADRVVFHHLSRSFRGAGTNAATVYYTLAAHDLMQPIRQSWIDAVRAAKAAGEAG